MNKILLSVTVFCIFLFTASTTFAEIKVVSVKGHVAYKTGPTWRKPLQRGMKLREGIKISTGVRSSAVLNINGNIVTIKPLTMMKIYSNKLTKKNSRTRIGLRRGSLRTKIKRRKNIRTSFKVSTPVATSSVRGTDWSIFYGPGRGMITYVHDTGAVEGENWNGISRTIGGRLRFHQKPTSPLPEELLARIMNKSFGFGNQPGLNPRNTDLFNPRNPIIGDLDLQPVIYWPRNHNLNSIGLNGFFNTISGTVVINILWP